MKVFSKSVTSLDAVHETRSNNLPPWMTPAACGALVLDLIVHCRTSSVPVVKNPIKFNAFRIVTTHFGRIDLVPSFLHSSSTSASVAKFVRRCSNETEMGIIGSPGECSLIHPATAGRYLFF